MHRYGIESYIAVPLNRRDGTYFGTLCTLDPLPSYLTDDDFEVFHLLSHLISYELESEEQKRHRLAEIRALEDVIAIATHDIRQPLAALSGRAELLRHRATRGATVEDMLPGLDTIIQQAQRASRLNEALLDLAQIETGSVNLDRRAVDIVELVGSLIDDARMVGSSHTLSFQGPAALAVHADEARISRVVRNLLDNAIKYAPADSGPIQVSVEQVEEDVVRVRVCDHGPGVRSEELEHLFERHYRAPDASERRISGSGLGLYIVRQVIALHGGTVWAEHTAGGGLTVCFDLPKGAAPS